METLEKNLKVAEIILNELASGNSRWTELVEDVIFKVYAENPARCRTLHLNLSKTRYILNFLLKHSLAIKKKKKHKMSKYMITDKGREWLKLLRDTFYK